MNSAQAPRETEAKSREDWIRGGLVMLAVVLPNILHDAVGLPLSWGYVFGVAVASTLAFFFLPGIKNNMGRFVQITLALCLAVYLLGRFVG